MLALKQSANPGLRIRLVRRAAPAAIPPLMSQAAPVAIPALLSRAALGAIFAIACRAALGGILTLANDLTETRFQSPDVPQPALAYWYLVRPVNCAASGTYNTDGRGQQGSRDAEIAASLDACP